MNWDEYIFSRILESADKNKERKDLRVFKGKVMLGLFLSSYLEERCERKDDGESLVMTDFLPPKSTKQTGPPVKTQPRKLKKPRTREVVATSPKPADTTVVSVVPLLSPTESEKAKAEKKKKQEEDLIFRELDMLKEGRMTEAGIILQPTGPLPLLTAQVPRNKRKLVAKA